MQVIVPFLKKFIVFAIVGLTPGLTHALQVRIEAPAELAALLDAHLEIAQAARLKEPIAPEELARLREASLSTARDVLATEGYFSPQIRELPQGAGNDLLVVRITPGPRTRVNAVAIRFVGEINQADEHRARLRARIERDFPLKTGMPFRQADWTKAKNSAVFPLLNDAYPAARLADSAARVVPEQRSVELDLTIDSGPVFYFGALEIVGSKRYSDDIARHLSPFRSGQVYRQQSLLDYQVALEQSGYYAQALVTINPDPDLAAAVPVQVRVTEKPAKSLSFGLGVSSDTGARVQTEYLQRNFRNRGLRLKLNAKAETRQQSGGAELAWPQNAQGFQDSLGAQLKHSDIEGLTTDSFLLAGRRSRTRGPLETGLSLQYQIENQQAGDGRDDRNRALTANYSWTRRKPGPGFYPTSGHVLNAQVGGATEAMLSDRSFVRLYARHTQYVRLGRQSRLVLRGELGSVLAQARDGIPTDFLFRAGGDNSVRGYAYQSLGEHTAGGVQPVRYLATASIEYNHFFNPTWGMAVFVDAGDAADSAADLAPVMGVGAGVRYRSPVGPLNLDVAYGEAAREFRLHFSLGLSF